MTALLLACLPTWLASWLAARLLVYLQPAALPQTSVIYLAKFRSPYVTQHIHREIEKDKPLSKVRDKTDFLFFPMSSQRQQSAKFKVD